MKNAYFYIAVGTAAFASALYAENIVLFDTSTPSEKVLIGRNPATKTPPPRATGSEE